MRVSLPSHTHLLHFAKSSIWPEQQFIHTMVTGWMQVPEPLLFFPVLDILLNSALQKISIKSFFFFQPACTQHSFLWYRLYFILFSSRTFSIIPAGWWRKHEWKTEKGFVWKHQSVTMAQLDTLWSLPKLWHLLRSAWGDTRHNGFDKKAPTTQVDCGRDTVTWPSVTKSALNCSF